VLNTGSILNQYFELMSYYSNMCSIAVFVSIIASKRSNSAVDASELYGIYSLSVNVIRLMCCALVLLSLH